MKNSTAKAIVAELAKSAGIIINGSEPWDIQVHNEKFYKRVLQDRTLGLGESYMDEWWSCSRLDECVDRVVRAKLGNKIKLNTFFLLQIFLAKFINFQTKPRSLEVAVKHYDLSNDLFQHMLDKEMNYSCGYWRNATNLEEAQMAKLDLVCQKLMLKPGMRVLDIGCGWGGFAKYAAKHYDVHVVGITISKQQYEYAKNNCAGHSVEIRLQDYRDISESFDHVVSLGMFEHVGLLNYRIYMEGIHKCLAEGGLFLLHTMGFQESLTYMDQWVEKYIFPNAMLPSIAQIGKSIEGLFVMEDWHNFGAYYDQTLQSWFHNFNQSWEKLKARYDERFKRMWNYYLLYSAGCSRAREIQVWQVVLSKSGIQGGYLAPR